MDAHPYYGMQAFDVHLKSLFAWNTVFRVKACITIEKRLSRRQQWIINSVQSYGVHTSPTHFKPFAQWMVVGNSSLGSSVGKNACPQKLPADWSSLVQKPWGSFAFAPDGPTNRTQKVGGTQSRTFRQKGFLSGFKNWARVVFAMRRRILNNMIWWF